ncbi:MAG: endonuclease/exonuclease/phosphatase family protein [Gemmatimonadota bacterium]
MTLEPWLRRLGLVAVGTIVILYVITCQLGDRFWLALPFLYGPRWLLSLPLLGVLPWLAVAPRKAFWPALIGGMLVTFGLLDTHLGVGRITAGTGPAFRVLELNAGAGSNGATSVVDLLSELRVRDPDLVVVAECGNGQIREALRGLDGYHFRVSETSLCMLSKGAILEWSERDPMDIWKEGGAGAIVRAVVSTASGSLRVGLVHLETPRSALDNFPDLSSIPTLGDITRANTRQRDEESRDAKGWIFDDRALPTVVVGDFNLPAESAIFRRYWGDLRDAWGRAGIGTGHTKRTRWWGARIDHILTTPDIGARRSFIGRDVGSDHLPLIADLVLPHR